MSNNISMFEESLEQRDEKLNTVIKELIQESESRK